VRIKDSCWFVGTIYDPKELLGVSTVGPGVDEVLQVVSEPTPQFHGRVWARGSGIWHMAHVGPEWSHGMAYDDTRHTNVAKRGRFLDWVDRRGRRSSKGVDCDILVPGMVIS
jgi:hypothetical protein